MEEFINENIWWLGWVLIFFVFWFFILRPKVNAQKKEESFRNSLKKGQKIVILNIKQDDTWVFIKTAQNKQGYCSLNKLGKI